MEESVLMVNKLLTIPTASYLYRCTVDNPFPVLFMVSAIKACIQYSIFWKWNCRRKRSECAVVRGSDGEVFLDDKGLTKRCFLLWRGRLWIQRRWCIYEDINSWRISTNWCMVIFGQFFANWPVERYLNWLLSITLEQSVTLSVFGNKISAIKRADVGSKVVWPNNNQSAAVNGVGVWRTDGRIRSAL